MGKPVHNRAMKDHEYVQPERFDPIRHLEPDGQLKPQAKQVYSILFGFGRRYVLNMQALSNKRKQGTWKSMSWTHLRREFTVGSRRRDVFLSTIR